MGLIPLFFFYFMRSLHEVHRLNAYGMTSTVSHFTTPKIA
jgi:hypothetical protein